MTETADRPHLPAAKALWERLHDVAANEQAWAILEEGLSQACVEHARQVATGKAPAPSLATSPPPRVDGVYTIHVGRADGQATTAVKVALLASLQGLAQALGVEALHNRRRRATLRAGLVVVQVVQGQGTEEATR
jgi:hypothetical protein